MGKQGLELGMDSESQRHELVPRTVGPGRQGWGRGGLGRAVGRAGLARGHWLEREGPRAQQTCRMCAMAPWSLEFLPVPGEAVRPSTWGRGCAFCSLHSR